MRERNFIIRVLRKKDLTIVNLCDEESLGRIIQGDGMEMKISEDYFGGEYATGDEAISLMRKCQVANLVGNRIVKLAIDSHLATHEAVRDVGGTSFLMIFK